MSLTTHVDKDKGKKMAAAGLLWHENMQKIGGNEGNSTGVSRIYAGN
jgi:hypothetical protein